MVRAKTIRRVTIHHNWEMVLVIAIRPAPTMDIMISTMISGVAADPGGPTP